MYSIGGWNTNPGSWSSGLRSRPLAGTGKFRSNGFEVSRMNSRKPIDIAPSTASAVAVRSTGRRRLHTDTAALQPVSINIHNSIEPSCAPQTAVSRYISGRLAPLLAAQYANAPARVTNEYVRQIS